ncbi:MAG: AMP-binding protein [candidate division NC10 bacterium]|nr:AMP-binding protein [candidate division NC10 bacterium]MDE2321764.1 AMP-binding protein [candidate division NC10 bacterium]
MTTSSSKPCLLDPSSFAALRVSETIGEIVRYQAEHRMDEPWCYLLSDPDSDKPVQFDMLCQEAERVAALLQELGVQPGDRVLIMLPTGRPILQALFGTWLAGAVAVPTYPPLLLPKALLRTLAAVTATHTYAPAKWMIDRLLRQPFAHRWRQGRKAGRPLMTILERLQRLSRYVDQQIHVCQTSRPALVIAEREFGPVCHAAARFLSKAPAFVAASDLLRGTAQFRMPNPDGNATALIQFTSGSTGIQKGVMLSHRAIMANILAFGEAIQPRPDDRVVSWLPLYHDMGLIGVTLGSLALGMEAYLMSPTDFTRDPIRWMWALHQFRATISVANNSAIGRLARMCRIAPRRFEQHPTYGHGSRLDLSHLRILMNGAEPVTVQAMEAFQREFGQFGLHREALSPVYGLAEMALAVSFPDLAAPYQVCRQRGEEWVSVGRPLQGFEIRIIDGEGNQLPTGRLGEVIVAGPSLMDGYFGDPEATAQVIRERDGQRWLYTGDEGMIDSSGELYITGRLKETVIKGGRNYAPAPLEEVIETVEGVKPGRSVVFGVTDVRSGTQRVVAVVECTDPQCHESLRETLTREIRSRVDDVYRPAGGTVLDQVLLIAPGTLSKTTSGKRMRLDARERFLRGEFS